MDGSKVWFEESALPNCLNVLDADAFHFLGTLHPDFPVHPRPFEWLNRPILLKGRDNSSAAAPAAAHLISFIRQQRPDCRWGVT